MAKIPLITFSCPATSTWTEVTPKLGCHFTPSYIKYAGFADRDRDHPCACVCSGQVPECKGGSVIFWSDVSTPEVCAQMMCSHNRFSQCSWSGDVVADNGFWNGDNVKFNSHVLQETCAGVTATVDDLCGTVIASASVNHVTSLMSWNILSESGLPLSKTSGVNGVTDVSMPSVWLPCGKYQMEFTDDSFEGGGWRTASLELKTQLGFRIQSFSNLGGSDLHKTAVPFEITESGISSSMVVLCRGCQGEPQPCRVPTDDSALPSLCEPFVPGTSECPPNTVRCT